MPLKTRPFHLPDDLPHSLAIGRLAFTHSSHALFPNFDPNDPANQPQKDDLAWRGARFEKRFREGCPAFVAVDITAGEDREEEKETIVGLAHWKPPKQEGEGREEKKKEEEEEELALPGTMDVELYKRVMGELEKKEREMLELAGVGEGDVWYLLTIATHPDHKRRGIGKMLLQWGIDQATADKKHVFLTATVEGRFLYERQGFKTLGEYDILGEVHTGMILYCDGR